MQWEDLSCLEQLSSLILAIAEMSLSGEKLIIPMKLLFLYWAEKEGMSTTSSTANEELIYFANRSATDLGLLKISSLGPRKLKALILESREPLTY